MTNKILRSGSLNDFQVLGEYGRRPFEFALQIRETLRLKKLPLLAETLAIPSVHAHSQHINWYAPFPGKILSWTAADEGLRHHARQHIDRCREHAAALSASLAASHKPSARLFGMLLKNIFDYPAENFIYFVDGRPVITFWGFSRFPSRVEEDEIVPDSPAPAPSAAFLQNYTLIDEAPLTETEPEEIPDLTDEAVPFTVTLNDGSPEVPGEVPPRAEDKAPVTHVKKRSRVKVWLPVLMLCGMAAAGTVLFTDILSAKTPWQAGHDVMSPSPVKLPVPVPAPAPAPHTLPLQQATVVPPPPKPAPAPAFPPQTLPPNALRIPAEALKMGTTRFLNGIWRVVADIDDPLTGKPVALRYRIKNNRGIAEITTAKNEVCSGNISAGVMSSGKVVIRSRSKARCPSGGSYPLPEVVCSQGEADIAHCIARYENDVEVPASFRREIR